jgi:hypothetical protein
VAFLEQHPGIKPIPGLCHWAGNSEIAGPGFQALGDFRSRSTKELQLEAGKNLDQLGQGRENARNFLRDNPDLANEIGKKIKEKLGVGPRLDAEAADKEPASGAGLRAVPNVAAGTAAAAGGTSGRGVTRVTGGPGGAG